jgi:putative transposase
MFTQPRSFPAMLRLLAALVPALRSAFRSRRELLLENIALRQQLATMVQRGRPRIRPVDRAFWVALRRVWSRWADILVIVKPETVIAWHRAGFRFYWRWLSRKGKRSGRQPLAREVRDLIRRMASENGWGAPRIHGELAKLGFSVSERTVSRYLRTGRRRPESRQSWRTFLRNHREVIVAMDFFTVPTATFRLLYVWFAMKHSRREILHWSVTENPTATWVIQQLREAFPFDAAVNGSSYLLFDRDAIFSREVVAAIRSMAIDPKRTSYQSPWQNGVAERFVGSVRRELLNHVIVLDDGHLQRLLSKYICYYHEDRTHLGLGKDTPLRRPVEWQPEPTSNVVGLPRVGGLHRRYAWRRAA